MPWWVFVVFGNLLVAVAVVFDKFLVSGPIESPRRYAMLSAIVSIFGVFLVIPGLLGFWGEAFMFQAPTFWVIIFGLVQSAATIAALFFLFSAFKQGEASRVAPVVGALNAIFTLAIALVFLQERASAVQFIGVGFSILGALFLTLKAQTLRALHHYAQPALFSGFLFAVAYVVLKALFNTTTFITVMVVVAVGQFLVGLLMLLTTPHHEKKKGTIVQTELLMPKRTFTLFVAKQAFASFGTLAITFSISLANVSLVNATEGLKYAFLFCMVILLSIRFPHILREDLAGSSLGAKIAGIVFVGMGLAFLALPDPVDFVKRIFLL